MATKPKKGAKAPEPLPKEAQEPMCVVAFRLPIRDREAIHAAAGRGKASAFALAAIRDAVQWARKVSK